MKKDRKKEYLKRFFKLQAQKELYLFAINRYQILRNERMVKRYELRIKNEVLFELEKLIEENKDFALTIDYQKESENYPMTEKATKMATLKYLGKSMDIHKLVKWSNVED